LHNDILEVLYSEEVIQKKVQELGASLSSEYEGRNPLVICVLKGAFIFMADLSKNITIPIELDFMAVSSYGNSTALPAKSKSLKIWILRSTAATSSSSRTLSTAA